MFTHEQLQLLNELEFEVYKYVSVHLEEVPKMKIRDLADKAHVSTSTVLRFCHKVGCDGYSELKVNIKKALCAGKYLSNESQLLTLIDYFQSIQTKEFQEQLNTVAQVLAHANQVIYCGIGSSGILAKYGARWMMTLGKPAYHMDDSWLTVPKGWHDNTVLIALTVSGETQQIIQLIDEFKSQGLTVITISASVLSTAARMSDYVIAYPIPIEYVPNTFMNTTTQAPCIFIIEQLARYMHNHM